MTTAHAPSSGDAVRFNNDATSPEKKSHHGGKKPGGTFSAAQLKAALPLAIKKMDPRLLYKTPVMFLVEVGALFTLILAIAHPSLFTLSLIHI